MITLKFFVEWPGELAAGIRPGSEDVTITLSDTTPEYLDEDQIEGWREAVKQQYDGAYVYTQKEIDAREAGYREVEQEHAESDIDWGKL